MRQKWAEVGQVDRKTEREEFERKIDIKEG